MASSAYDVNATPEEVDHGSTVIQDAARADEALALAVLPPTFLSVTQTLTAPSRNTWHYYNVVLTGADPSWTFNAFTYTWLISGGYNGDVGRTDIQACIHAGTSWQACGDVRNTQYSPEAGTSNFAVSFPVTCYLCPSPPVLRLGIKVGNNPNDPNNTKYKTPITASFAAGTGRMFFTTP